jgi:transposase InsO family protein
VGVFVCRALASGPRPARPTPRRVRRYRNRRKPGPVRRRRAEGVHALAQKPVLHGDNGSTLKATTVLAMMYWPGLKASCSRPRVSDDNAFVESLFRTAKYRPEFPAKGFAICRRHASGRARSWIGTTTVTVRERRS